MAGASRKEPHRATLRPRLGLVCITYSDECRFRTITRTRFLSLPEDERRAALERVYWENLDRLHGAMGFCARRGIGLYRVTSSLFPLSDEPLGADVLSEMAALLSSFGRRAERLGIRVLTHPDQFVVLNSESPAVADTSRSSSRSTPARSTCSGCRGRRGRRSSSTGASRGAARSW